MITSDIPMVLRVLRGTNSGRPIPQETFYLDYEKFDEKEWAELRTLAQKKELHIFQNAANQEEQESALCYEFRDVKDYLEEYPHEGEHK